MSLSEALKQQIHLFAGIKDFRDTNYKHLALIETLKNKTRWPEKLLTVLFVSVAQNNDHTILIVSIRSSKAADIWI